jgi:hypothetical protein
MIFLNEFNKKLVEQYGFIELYDEDSKLSWLMLKSMYVRLAGEDLQKEIENDDEV